MKEKVKRADSVMVARLAAVWEARVRVPVSPEKFFSLWYLKGRNGGFPTLTPDTFSEVGPLKKKLFHKTSMELLHMIKCIRSQVLVCIIISNFSAYNMHVMFQPKYYIITTIFRCQCH